MATEQVIYVDERDREIGTGEKLDAHKRGILHRAISVFIFNNRGELMLQKRAKTKYHSAGLWSNTCCSHPRPGEGTAAAAHRRLQEEMGLSCRLKKVHHLLYRVQFDNGLTEHEFDHMFIGTSNKSPVLNPDEAEDWKWMSPEDIKKDIAAYPEQYSYWFKLALEDIMSKKAI